MDALIAAALEAAGIDYQLDQREQRFTTVLRPAIALSNLVACFPREAKRAGINEPPKEAIKACSGRLSELIAMASPKLIVTVGALAEKYTPAYDAKRVNVTHPAAILRANEIAADMAKRRIVVALADAFASL